MKPAPSKSLPLTILSVAAALFLLIVVLAPTSNLLGSFATSGVNETEDVARLVVWEAQVRTVLNVTVVVLQITGLASFLLTSFFPGGQLARRGQHGFVTAMLGLGVAGSLCAWYGSEFALFSGGSMAVLLNGVILGSGTSHGASVSDLLGEADRSPLTV